MQLTNTLTYSVTVDELISYPNWTTPLPVHARLNQSVPPSSNWWYFGELDEQVDITVAHLHFMAHCRRLAALIRVACLWLEAWDQPGTSVMFFVFFKRVEGVDSIRSLQKYGYLKRSTLCSIYLSSSLIDLIPFSLSLSHDSCH